MHSETIAIGVLSGPGPHFVVRRAELRQSYFADRPPSVAYRFALRCGGLATPPPDATFSDVLCTSVSHTLPRSQGVIRLLLAWYAHASRAHSSARFIGKIDDDAYINLPLLDTLLGALPDGPTYLGAMYRWNYDPVHETLARWGGGSCATCIGPFQFAVGTLMVLDRALCSDLIEKRMGERYLAQLDGWSMDHRVLFEDAWLGMILTLNRVNLTYYDTKLIHSDRQGFKVPTTLLGFHNRNKLGCRNRQLHAYYKVRADCRPRVDWKVGRSFRGLRTLWAHPETGAGCTGEVDLRNATVRAFYGVAECPP